MALYAIGDLHLSLNSNKSMEVFGPAWENYTERIRASLSQLTAEDVLVLAGDTSWGMSLEESVEDFRFLEQFPCKKYLIKGNHDYWWSTANKMNAYLKAEGFAKKCRFRKAETAPMEVLPGVTLDITTWEKLWR